MEEAAEISDRIGIIDHGRLIADGTHDDLVRIIGEADRIKLHAVDNIDAAVKRWETLPGVKRVSVDGTPIKVTPLEYRLLNYLMHHLGQVVTQEELIENIYYRDQEPDSNAVEVLVGRLRRKIGAGVIETHRGFGYMIAREEA